MVQCILHGLMGIGRLVCTFVEDQVDDYGSSKGKAVAKILRVCRVRWQLGRTPKPTGEGTWQWLLFAWPKLVKWFGLEGAPADIAVRDMTSLLRRLYSTWASDSAMAECKEISGRFRQEIAPRSASHYLLFFEEICPILLPDSTWAPLEARQAQTAHVFALSGYPAPCTKVWAPLFAAWESYGLGTYSRAGSHGARSPANFAFGPPPTEWWNPDHTHLYQGKLTGVTLTPG